MGFVKRVRLYNYNPMQIYQIRCVQPLLKVMKIAKL